MPAYIYATSHANCVFLRMPPPPPSLLAGLSAARNLVQLYVYILHTQFPEFRSRSYTLFVYAML